MGSIFSVSSLAIAVGAISICSVGALAVPNEDGGHNDIWVTSSNGQLVTGGWDDTTGEVTNPTQRVFEADFGADPFFPFSGDEPGIGSDLIGSTLYLTISAGLGAWTGTGFELSTSMVSMSYGGQSGDTASGGFFNFLVTQGLDLHAEFALSGPGGEDPSSGLYLATFRFESAGFADSAPLWVVFNLGMSEADHEAAVVWVESNLLPAPGVMAIAALSAITGAGSRSRRR
jgi:hypothetical protein